MAFTPDTFARSTESMNTGYVVAPGTAAAIGSPVLFTYSSVTDTVATIEGANYFTNAVYKLSVNDFIFVVASDASIMLQVATIDRSVIPATITTQTFGTSTTVGTSNILSGAVTTAKIANNAVTTALLANNAVTSAQLAINVLQYAQVAVTAAQFKAAFATPFVLVAAPGAGIQLVLQSARIKLAYGTTQYTAGGAVFLQFGSTVNAGGIAASNTIAAAGFTGATANSCAQFTGTQALALCSVTENEGLYLTNATANFATGDSTFTVDVWYSVVTN